MKTKKLLSLVLAVLLLVGLLPSASLTAYAEQEGDWTYTVSGSSATVTGYTGSDTDIEIPSTLGGNTVTSIDSMTFEGCSSLTSVKIPSTVTSIGTRAFFGCSSLKSIEIPSGVTSIEDYTFYDCSSLESITLPSTVTYIDSRVFENCSSLESITLPDAVTYIDLRTFSNCSSLKSIEIPSGVTSINNATFSGCSSLESITIPDTVTLIDYRAFCGCSSLESIRIPDGVTSIGDNAFEDCSSLTSITIPSGVTSIGEWMFANCSSLESITIPSTVTSLGSRIFESCYALTSIEIPFGVTSIGNDAFRNCSSLESVSLPSSVTLIDVCTFSGCSSLESVSLPDTLTSIGGAAFELCSSLTSIEIPSSVTSIVEYAFYGCDNLTDINYGGSCVQWQSIAIGSYNDTLASATLHPTENDHVYKTSYTSDQSKHWYECEACDAKKDEATHTFDNDSDFICNVCTHEVTSYTISFDAGGGSAVPDTSTNNLLKPATLPTPTKANYKFDGWFTEATGGSEVTLDTVFWRNSTVYARWTPKTVPTVADFNFTPTANLTYDGTEKTATVTVKEGVTGMGTVTVKYEPTERINADTYTVKIDVDEGTDYASATDITHADWTFTITPAEPTVTPPTASRVRRGNALSTSTLTGGAAKGIDDVELTGTFAWKDGTEVLNTNGTEQKAVVFTPDNTFANYKAIEFNVDVEVYTPSSGGGTIRYTVKFKTNSGSTIKNASVTRNNKVTEPTAPTKEGYVFDGWYTDKELTEKYDFESKVTKSFTLYAKWNIDEEQTQPVEPTEWQNPFTDVNENDWFYNNVKFVHQNGLMKGTSETTFAPNLELTRGMFVTILYRLDGEPQVNRSKPFADVNADDYFANAVIWAEQNEIVKGVSETEFAPNANITREQMATILYRYAKYKGYDVSVGEDTNILSYDDAFDVSDYAYPALQWTCGAGLIRGRTETTLNPQDNATRAETAAILQRFIEGNVK